jgi:hypothetical protein
LNGYLIGPPLKRGPDLATECSPVLPCPG